MDQALPGAGPRRTLHAQLLRKHITGLTSTADFEARVMELRMERNLVPHRIQAELQRSSACVPRTRTIWKVLRSRNAPPLRKPWRPRRPHRYSRPIPGERVQVDRLMDPSAVQDQPPPHPFHGCRSSPSRRAGCMRFRVQPAPMVLGLYPKRNAVHGTHFLVKRILKEFPFPVQRIQRESSMIPLTGAVSSSASCSSWPCKSTTCASGRFARARRT